MTYFLSPKALKTTENARARQQIRMDDADRGPHLREDDATVVIPSPTPHEKFNAILRRYEFRFEPSLTPSWVRATDAPHLGRRYSAKGWLEWAVQHYSRAWPDWKRDR